MQDVVYDVSRTRDRLLRSKRVSWSNFDNFRTCKGLWFTNYVLQQPEFLDIPPLEKDHTRAIPGILIQKIMETFINERIYKREGMTGIQEIVNWMEHNCYATYFLSRFPKDIQFQKDFLNPFRFWETTTAQQHLQDIRSKYNLDPCISEVGISFVDNDNFNNIYGSEETFLQHLYFRFQEIIKLFLVQQFYLDFIYSEIKLEAQLHNGYTLIGHVDFIYNQKQKQEELFTNITQLQDGYFLFDGKYNITTYTKKEQLFFYASLVYLLTKKLPARLALLSWNKAEFQDHVLNPLFLDVIQEVLSEMTEVINKIAVHLEGKKDITGCLFSEDFLQLNPEHTNCQFCTALPVCPAAKEKGITSFNEIQEKMQARKEVKNFIESLPPGQEDITF